MDSYLCCTVAASDLGRAQYLLWEKKADPDATCKAHHTSALYMACENQQLDFVETLITNTGKPANTNRFLYRLYLNALCIAVKSRNLALVHLLLKKAIIKPNLEYRSCNQVGRACTALSRAAFLGDIPIAEALIDAGADVNSRNDNAPLMMAALVDNLEMCRFLLEKGCNVNTIRRDLTAIYYASCAEIENPKSQDDPYKVVKLLLQYGADPTTPKTRTMYYGKDLGPRNLMFLVFCMDVPGLLDVFIQYRYLKITKELMFYAMEINRAGNCCVSLLGWGYSTDNLLFDRAARNGYYGLMLVLIDLDPRFLRKSCLCDISSFSKFAHRPYLREFQAWLEELLPCRNQSILLVQMCRMKIQQQLRHNAILMHTRIPNLIQQLPLPTKLKSFLEIPSIKQVLERAGHQKKEKEI